MQRSAEAVSASACGCRAEGLCAASAASQLQAARAAPASHIRTQLHAAKYSNSLTIKVFFDISYRLT